jgi:hypothetical protein
MRAVRLGCWIAGLDVGGGAAGGWIRCAGFSSGVGLVTLGSRAITGFTSSGSCWMTGSAL